MDQFVKERNEAFTKAVMEDDWGAVKRYCKKYRIPIPAKKNVMKAGTYKAVQQCADIPDHVKDVAFKKCLELGFSPWVDSVISEEEGDD